MALGFRPATYVSASETLFGQDQNLQPQPTYRKYPEYHANELLTHFLCSKRRIFSHSSTLLEPHGPLASSPTESNQ